MSPSVEPFDEAKCKALMDGREIIEVQFKQLSQIIDYRIEAEYFCKRFVNNEMLLYKKQSKPLLSIASVQNGRAYSSVAFSPDGDLYISKIGDVTNKRTIEEWEKLLTEEFKNQHGKYLRDGDILMTLTGDPPDVGKVNLIAINEERCTWNQRVARIRKISNDFLSNYSLYAVLSSEIVRMQMERFAKGIRQRNLGNDCFSYVKVPILDEKYQILIDDIVRKHILLLDKSKMVYKEAEKILANTLNVRQVRKGALAKSEKRYSESLLLTGRLDAEYYQPKYDALFALLSKVKTKKLGGADGVVNILKSIDPGSDAYVDEGIPFVRVSDVNKFEIIDPEIKLDTKLISTPEKLFPKKNTILFSKDGSVGIAYKVEEDLRVITSGALLHLTVRDSSEVLTDYLTLVLNSPIVQLQAERDSSGAIIQHWKPSEIEKVIIPILDMTIQKEIAAKVQESFAFRKKSKQLLEYAKRAVEMAIEQGEDVALEWLKGKANEEV